MFVKGFFAVFLLNKYKRIGMALISTPPVGFADSPLGEGAFGAVSSLPQPLRGG